MRAVLQSFVPGLVCEYTLAICARDVELGKYLLLSRGEDATGGRERDSILSDAFEALIGAIYLDGGMDRARTFIHTHLLKDVKANPYFMMRKRFCRRWCRQVLIHVLSMSLQEKQVQTIIKRPTVEAKIGGKTYAIGKGKTKKGAEQIAAYQTILLLKKRRR